MYNLFLHLASTISANFKIRVDRFCDVAYLSFKINISLKCSKQLTEVFYLYTPMTSSDVRCEWRSYYNNHRNKKIKNVKTRCELCVSILINSVITSRMECAMLETNITVLNK